MTAARSLWNGTITFGSVAIPVKLFSATSPHTLVFYESPHRIAALIEDARVMYGDRRAALANDLTKMFERVDRGTLSELLAVVQATEPRGEYALVIEGATSASGEPEASADEASVDEKSGEDEM